MNVLVQLLREDYKKHVKQSAHEHFVTVAEHVCDLKKEVKQLREGKSVVAIPDASLMEVGEFTIFTCMFYNYVIGVHIATVHSMAYSMACTKCQPTL